MSDSQFPHLTNATEYPGTGNVDAYAAANRFDYDRWTDDVHIHMCNVTWDGIESIVDWTAENKKAYFDDTEKREIEMPTAFQMPAREDTFKVPVPFITAQTYNYIYIDVPLPPDDSYPLDYVEPQAATRRFYWFIDDMRQVAPSTTELQLRQDLWTTYSDYLQMKNCVLQRGHYPVAQQPSVSTFLSNPIGNMRWLSAPDVEAGQVGTRTHETFVPINQGARYVVFASTMPLSALQSCGRAADAGENTDATYSAGSIEWDDTYTKTTDADFNMNYMLNIDDYSWDGMPSQLFDDCHVNCLQHSARSSQYLNNYALWAVDGADYQDFMEWLHEKVPFVIQTIASIFSIDKSLVDWSESYTLAGVTVRLVRGLINEVIQGLTLSQADFDYPTQAQRFTKLYTSPYSYIEISDYEGRDYRFDIQQVASSAAVVGSANVAFPTLVIDAYVRGVGGSGTSNTYATHGNQNNETDNTDPVGDHSARFTWQLPCSGMPIRAWHQYSIDNDRERKNKRQQAILNYRTAARNFNASWGVGRTSNLVNSENAKLNRDNAVTINSRTNDKINECTYSVGDSRYYEYGNENCLTPSNLSSTAECELYSSGIGAYISSEQTQKQYSEWQSKAFKDYARQRQEEYRTTHSDYILQNNIAYLQYESTLATSFINSLTGVANSIVGAAGSTVGSLTTANPNVAGAAISSAASVVTSTMSAAANMASSAIIATTNMNVNSQTLQRNIDVWAWNWSDPDYASLPASIPGYNQDGVTGLNRRLYNSSNTYNEDMADATESYNTESARYNIRAHLRASNITHTMTDNNIETQKDTDTSLLNNSLHASNQNTDNIRFGTRHAAQLSVDAAQTMEQRTYNQSKIADNIMHGEFRLDSTGVINEKKCGIAWQVMRQATGDVWRVASEFARFGYTLGQFVETSNLQPMNMFCYWQVTDISFVMDDAGLQADNVPTAALDGIKTMFINGITIWSNPAEIGQVSIYDN